MLPTSTFASRKAAAEAANAERSKQRLVSQGESKFSQRNTQNGEIETIPVELFVDRDHPRLRYAQFPGPIGMVPLQNDTGPSDRVTRLAPMKGRRLSRPDVSAYPEALPEPPPRPV